jgi:hypothetical protein
MKRRTFLKIGTGAAVGGALTACGGGGSTASVPDPSPQIKAVVGWNQAALQAVRVVKPGPPMAARSLAILHTCMFNAWAAYDATALGTPHGPAVRMPVDERTPANKSKAMSYAAHAALVDQFPSQKAAFDAYMTSLGYDPTLTASDVTTAPGIGSVVAAAMIEFCHQDGANQLGNLAPGGIAYANYTRYAPKNPAIVITQPTALDAIPSPGSWQPLTFTDPSGAVRTPVFVGASWDRLIPFALSSAEQFRPGPPARFGTPEYVAQAQHVVDVQLSLTEQQKVIAEYWSDGPNSELPPGHWCLIAQFVSERDRHTDDEDVKMFFALSNALSDTAIAAWDAKLAYDSERPITAIRYLMNGKTIIGYGPQGPAAGLRTIAGEAWLPYQPITFPTPPFPEHVSGHSAFSAAAAEVLKRYTGSDTYGATYTKPARSMALEPSLPSADVTLHWASFTEAADEAGISRIYGGIHFDNGNAAGKELGRAVGTLAFEKAQGYWQGQA